MATNDIEFEFEDHFDGEGLGGIEAAIERATEAAENAEQVVSAATAKLAEAVAAAADARAAAEAARSAVSKNLRFWFEIRNGHFVIADAGEDQTSE